MRQDGSLFISFFAFSFLRRFCSRLFQFLWLFNFFFLLVFFFDFFVVISR